jgi:uncharacterized protein YjbI with pentapeptide repeats
MEKKPKEIPWQQLERQVRSVAEAKFGGTARAEDIAGVKCDCVIRLTDGSAVLVEISKERTIDKLRQDINKFNTIRPFFIQQNIFPKCFFVTLGSPTPALIAAGQANHVQVYSFPQFFNFILGLGNYLALRQKQAFGSAIDLYSGAPDENKYVEVEYASDSGVPYTPERIAGELRRGRTVVLIGDYGTGKSRCVKEIFASLVANEGREFMHPIAINLRDNWGLKRAQELITRHFTDLGLGERVPDVLKTAFSSANIYLLDGFDEVGAQTWSDDPTKLVDIRKQSLVGVKDLIQRSNGGVLITGREHYFNNDAELLECLALGGKEVLLLRCPQELSEDQFSELIGGSPISLPRWVPKKPLIGIIIRSIGDARIVRELFETSTGQVDFWDLLLNTFCEREAKINPILDGAIIRSLYAKIGRLSRMTRTPLGPISIKEINDAFEMTTGRPPTDESAIILQRLPGLSRIGAESLDRQFIDEYILDGLKAEDILGIYSASDTALLDIAWKHPIGTFGAFFVGTRLQSVNQSRAIIAYVKRHANAKNRVLLSDMIAALFYADSNSDFGGLVFKEGKFLDLAFSDCLISNISFDDCMFDNIDITDADPKGVSINRSVIVRVAGITSREYAPPWVTDCLFEGFQSTNTLAQIREAGLSVAQTFLLSSLRKLFLQPGSGRKHSSMYKGYGDLASKKICEKVIALLLRKGFCSQFRGTSEEVYVPDRSMTQRARLMLSQMTQSKDEVWLEVSRY